MIDPIYAGIVIQQNDIDSTMLHSVNNLYNAANNAFNILSKVNQEERTRIFEELKIPQEYTMQVISEQKDTAYSVLHYNLLKPFINELNVDQKEYMLGMSAFFNEVYAAMYMRQQPTFESEGRVKRAYNKLKASLDNKDKIFTETLLGPNMLKKPIVEFLIQQLNEILKAQEAASKLKEKTAEENNDDKDIDPGT